jgi:hypothetical protein
MITLLVGGDDLTVHRQIFSDKGVWQVMEQGYRLKEKMNSCKRC